MFRRRRWEVDERIGGDGGDGYLRRRWEEEEEVRR